MFKQSILNTDKNKIRQYSTYIYIHFKIFLQIGTKTLIHIQNLQLQSYRFTKKS